MAPSVHRCRIVATDACRAPCRCTRIKGGARPPATSHLSTTPQRPPRLTPTSSPIAATNQHHVSQHLRTPHVPAVHLTRHAPPPPSPVSHAIAPQPGKSSLCYVMRTAVGLTTRPSPGGKQSPPHHLPSGALPVVTSPRRLALKAVPAHSSRPLSTTSRAQARSKLAKISKTRPEESVLGAGAVTSTARRHSASAHAQVRVADNPDQHAYEQEARKAKIP